MKRFLLLLLALCGAVQLQARDITISSWLELADISLKKDDRIIKVVLPTDLILRTDPKDPETGFKMTQSEKVDPVTAVLYTESLDSAKPRKNTEEPPQEQYPKGKVIRYSRDTVRTKRNADLDYYEQTREWDTQQDYMAQTCAKAQKLLNICELSKGEYVRSDLSGIATNPKEAVEENKETLDEIYCIEDDSWWHARMKNVESRRIVLVLEREKDAYWQEVLVITPQIFNHGFKNIGKCFTYQATPEYRFSNPIKLAALLIMGAGLFAFLKTLAYV